MEDWLHSQVGPALDALKADPSRAVPLDQVHKRLRPDQIYTVAFAPEALQPY